MLSLACCSIQVLSYHVTGWYTVCQPYIVWLQGRKKDDTLFEDFKLLSDRMMDLEAKERQIARSEVELSEDDVKEFLEEELTC